MAATPANDPSWVDKKKRPLPQSLALSQKSFFVSRESGLKSTTGTFGAASRFDTGEKVRGRGRDSPNGREFYGRNQLYKSKLEVGQEPTLGIGDRPPLEKCQTPKQVGPGTYKIVSSAKGKKSPLDGPDYCYTTLGVKLPSKLVPVDSCSPGPHHSYEVRRNADTYYPTYGTENLGHGARHPYPEDTDGPGLNYAHHHTKGLGSSLSMPMLKGKGNKETPARTVKSTFGIASRFGAVKPPTSAPNGEMYYAHSKFWTSEDYIANARSCGFGGGAKTDFSNPMKGHRSNVSPVTYKPVASTCCKTSSFDGLVTRLESPTVAACRVNGKSPTHKNARSLSTPAAARTLMNPPPPKKASPVSSSPPVQAPTDSGADGGEAAA